MKKLFLVLCVALIGMGSAFAQSNLSWEGQIGMNVAKQSGYDSRIGYHLGARAKLELPSLTNGLYANAGAFLTLKGTSFDMGELGSTKTNLNYLEIPIHLGYQYAINDNFSVFGEFGPYFAIGLFGKTKVNESDWDDNYNLVSTSYSYNTFDEFKRFDFGLGFRFGVEFKQKYTLSIGYDFGLVNVWKEADPSDEEVDLTGKIKNKNLTIGVGYKF